MIESLLHHAARFLPALITLVIFSAIIWWLVRFTNKRQALADYRRTLAPQFLMVALAVIGLLIFLLTLPFSDTTRGQVVTLVGVILTGIIAISSTTFVTNAMAGLMLRWIRHFKAGDFIEVKGLFGRITERGLFHTEIQNEERDLITFPNLYLIANPITVTRSSGTIIPQKIEAQKMPGATRSTAPESVMFDKAESAEEMDQWQERHDGLAKKLEELKKGNDETGQIQVKLIEEEMARIKQKMEAYLQAQKTDEDQ